MSSSLRWRVGVWGARAESSIQPFTVESLATLVKLKETP